MGFILTIIAFNFIIIVHELGHFLVARLNGIKVLEFSLFVGPKLWGIKKGETEYSLRLIPVLAYVKMEGEEESSDDENAFSNKSVWARMAVVAAGPLANLLSALLILVAVFSFREYKVTKVAGIDDNSPAYTSGLKVGDEIISYNDRKVYFPMDLVQFFYVDNGKEAKLTVLRDGKKENINFPESSIKEDRYVLGFEAVDSSGKGSTVVKNVTKGYPASEAGILPNDKIVSIDDVDVYSISGILDYINENGDKEIKIKLDRNGKELEVFLTPKLLKDQPSINLGIEFLEYKGNVVDALKDSMRYIWSNIRSVGYSIKWLVSGKVSISKMSGPVGIVTSMNDAASVGGSIGEKIFSLLNMTAFINIAIGATNLIPFPALDGNKLLLLMIEVFRKKPISPEKESKISMIGLVTLLILALITTSNDIMKLIQRIRG